MPLPRLICKQYIPQHTQPCPPQHQCRLSTGAISFFNSQSIFIWADTWQNQWIWLQSAWASAQSDQSLLSSPLEAKDPSFLKSSARSLIGLGGWMCRLFRVIAGCKVKLFILSHINWFLTLWMLGNFSCFCYRLLFSKLTFSKNYFRNTIRVSNSLDLDQDWHSVGLDLGLYCLQSLSADNKKKVPTSKERVNDFVLKIITYETSACVRITCFRVSITFTRNTCSTIEYIINPTPANVTTLK